MIVSFINRLNYIQNSIEVTEHNSALQRYQAKEQKELKIADLLPYGHQQTNEMFSRHSVKFSFRQIHV